MHTKDIISCDEAGSLPGLFQRRVERTPEAAAYEQYDVAQSRWRRYTWREVQVQAQRWRRALAGVGLEPGDRVAILVRNSVEWVFFDQAALSLGLVVVPLYTRDNPENIAYVLGDSGSRLLVVGQTKQWQSLSQHREMFPELRTVISLESGPMGNPETRFHSVADWLSEEGAPLGDAVFDPDALATIVYTSGTTGRPKGVMLSHRNILWNAEAVSKIVPAYREDVLLSFLPLSHTLERTVGYYLPMMAGCRVAYARSIQTLPQDLLAIRPTVLIAVPRIYERANAQLAQQLERSGALARRLFHWVEDIGWRRFEHAQGRAAPLGVVERMVWPFLRRLVIDKINARQGGQLRVVVSGGGPLDEKIARRFLALGANILQGYGLTEVSPVVSSNQSDDNMPTSVGKALPGTEVRIGPDGELLVRSPSVMLGYWGLPEATQSTIDEEGWLHTGDVAEIKDDYIFIRGRKKEILVTSTGEKVPPADLEMALLEDPLFDQALVVGEGKPYVAAVIVLDQGAWREFAEGLSVDPDDTSSLSESGVVKAALRRAQDRLNSFPSYARVRAVYLTLEPWTVDNGLMTPTMKLKRQKIVERFAEAIHQLYADHEVPA